MTSMPRPVTTGRTIRARQRFGFRVPIEANVATISNPRRNQKREHIKYSKNPVEIKHDDEVDHPKRPNEGEKKRGQKRRPDKRAREDFKKTKTRR